MESLTPQVPLLFSHRFCFPEDAASLSPEEKVSCIMAIQPFVPTSFPNLKSLPIRVTGSQSCLMIPWDLDTPAGIWAPLWKPNLLLFRGAPHIKTRHPTSVKVTTAGGRWGSGAGLGRQRQAGSRRKAAPLLSICPSGCPSSISDDFFLPPFLFFAPHS